MSGSWCARPLLFNLRERESVAVLLGFRAGAVGARQYRGLRFGSVCLRGWRGCGGGSELGVDAELHGEIDEHGDRLALLERRLEGCLANGFDAVFIEAEADGTADGDFCGFA